MIAGILRIVTKTTYYGQTHGWADISNHLIPILLRHGGNYRRN